MIAQNYDHKLLTQAGEIKAYLVEYATKTLADALQTKLDTAYGLRTIGGLQQAEVMRFIDRFITQELLPEEHGGGWVIDKWLAETPQGQNLNDKARQMVRGWIDNVVEGYFEIREFDAAAQAWRLYSLLDEMEYIVRSNSGLKTMNAAKEGMFIVTRMLPIEDYWMFSGPQNLIAARERPKVLLEAAKLASRRPELIMRNPQKLAQAWDAQRRERAAFVAFFGEDLVIFPGNQLQERVEAYFHFRHFEWRGDNADQTVAGLTTAERYQQIYPDKAMSLPIIELPPMLTTAETVGVIYDELDGMNYFVDFARFEEAFRNPENLDEKSLNYQVVQGYLVEPTISPLPFKRMVARYPKNAGKVLAKILNVRNFEIEAEFNALMAQFKPEQIYHKTYPAVTVMPEHLKTALEEAETLAARLQNPKGANRNWKRPPKSGQRKK